jgi:hypothetical protein
MADTLHDPQADARDLRAHERTFHMFSGGTIALITALALI